MATMLPLSPNSWAVQKWQTRNCSKSFQVVGVRLLTVWDMSRILDVLRQRGLLYQMTNSAERVLQSPGFGVYAGFDPTATSLHVGNLLVILTLAHFQRAGYRPVALIGGATVALGDPSGRATERSKLQPDTVEANMRGIRANLERFLHTTGTSGMTIVDNREWYASMNVLDFFDVVGRNFRVSNMLGKDSVQSRLESSDGISYNEFSYQLLQGYDFCHLHRQANCRVQIGGSDQWGNIVAGTDLIRKVEGEERADVCGVTVPLLTTSTGEKFGKSAGNAVWLDPEMTSPYEFYQYFLQTTDDDVEKFLKMLTFLPLEEITEIAAEHRTNPGGRLGQRTLAQEVTRIVHGDTEVQNAARTSEVLFGKANASLSNIPLSAIESAFKDAPSSSSKAHDVLGTEFPHIAVVAGICKSKGEAVRLIKSGGFYVNNVRVDNTKATLGSDDIIGGRIVVFRSGKKKYFLLRVE